MWQVLRITEKMGSDYANSENELVQDTLRRLIVATGGIYLVWHFVATTGWPVELGWKVWITSVVFALVCFFALYLVPRHLLAAQLVWQIGLLSVFTLSILLLRQPHIAFLYALLPLMAVVTLGWPAGLFLELLIGLLLWGLVRSQTGGVSDGLALQVILGGGVAGVLGLAVSGALFTVTEWSLSSFERARESMEEARQHRAQLTRVLKSLDQAYYRLQRANSALVAAWKAADEAERYKTELATHVSHELRTPLNLIVGFAEMMITSPESYGGHPLPGPYRSDLNALCHSAQHLLALVDDVLDLTRIEARRIGLTRDCVDLRALVAESTDMVKDYIASKGLQLCTEVAEGLPELWIDRLRIRQVLLNLLVNAARFTEHGSVTVDVWQQAEEVVLRVTDTGQGIPHDVLPRVFDEFNPTELPVSGWHSGTGLGLPISKRLVELHHGRMGVESTYMQGTSFWFTLPCTMSPKPDDGFSRLAAARLVPQLGASERIIVVVHPDVGIVHLLQRYLDGYRVVSARNATEGMALAQELKALALVGYVDGQSCVAADDLIVVHCALPTSGDAARAIGADDLLVKPISREELLAALDRLRKPVHRVLVADGNPDMARLLQRMLHGRVLPQDCLEAHNGAEALDLIHSAKPDLVFLDLAIPGMDGHEVITALAADPNLKAVSVIVVSAKTQERITLQVHGTIGVDKAGGFELGEVVRALEAVFSALAPGWH